MPYQILSALLISTLLLNPLSTASAEEASEPTEVVESELHQEIYQEQTLEEGFELHPELYYETVSAPPVPYYLSGRGGATYTSGFGAGTDTGGAYGATFVLPLVRALYFYADGSFNHISGGTQFLGSVGIGKLGAYSQKSVSARIGWLVSFDQFTDSRVDDLYLANLRSMISYEVSPHTTVGVTYSTPLVDDVINVPVLAGGLGTTANVEAGRFLNAYLSYDYDDITVSASVGYRDANHETTLGLAGSMSLGDRATLFNQVRYGEQGNWTAFTGIEFRLSPGGSSSRCTSTGHCSSHAVALAASHANTDVVRGDLNGDGSISESELSSAGSSALSSSAFGESLYPEEAFSSALLFGSLFPGRSTRLAGSSFLLGGSFALPLQIFAGSGDIIIDENRLNRYVNRNRPVFQQTPQFFYSQVNVDLNQLQQQTGQNNNGGNNTGNNNTGNNNTGNNNNPCRTGETFFPGGTDSNGNPITGSCFDPATMTFRTIP